MQIIHDVRSYANEHSQLLFKGETPEEDMISRFGEAAIWACTTCNACVEACPVLISPVDPILDMRRYEILTESAGPGDWLPMFNSIENSGAVWSMPTPRSQWATDAVGE